MGSSGSKSSDTSEEESTDNYRYGDIRDVYTTGASAITARADGKRSRGVDASHEMAADDLPYVNNYEDEINSAANNYDVQPSVVAAIISRESRGGRALDSNGEGDHGNAFGLMQIDKRWHKLWVNPNTGAPYKWNSQKHIEQGIDILVDLYSDDIEKKFPRWNKNQKLKGALAAFNMGTRDMSSSYNNVDDHTTGGDYSNDVTARAQYYEEHGY